jgi:hypothetical protein
MPFLDDSIFDQGLDELDTGGTRVDICTQEPTTYAEATATYTLGNEAVDTGAPADGDVDGRKVVVPAIDSGAVTGDGMAAFWALTNGVDTLLATGPLAAPLPVATGGLFDLGAITITKRDPTAV